MSEKESEAPKWTIPSPITTEGVIAWLTGLGWPRKWMSLEELRKTNDSRQDRKVSS
jgi:hypothetical protein